MKPARHHSSNSAERLAPTRFRQGLALAFGVVALVGLPVQGTPQEAGQTRAPQAIHRLVPGQARTIRVDFVVGRMTVSDPLTCDSRIQAGGREILVTARDEGRAVLTIWDEADQRRADLEIEVVSAELIGRLDALDPLLAAYPGVRARMLGTRVAITGTVASEVDREAVRKIATSAGDVVVLVSVGRTPAPPPTAPTSSAQATRPAPAAAPPPAASPALPAGAATPVPLTSGSAGTATVPPTAPATPAPAAQEPRPAPTTLEPLPAAASSAPPPVAPVPPAAPPPAPPATARPAVVTPSDSAPPAAAPVEPAAGAPPTEAAAEPKPVVPAPASTPVDYVIELLEFPAATPQAAFLDPQARSLLRLRLSTTNTTRVRHSVAATGASGESAAASGRVDISLEPLLDMEGIVHTRMVVDTNLPLGPRPATAPGGSSWARAEVEFSSGLGETRSITGQSLAEASTYGEPGAELPPDERSDAAGLSDLLTRTPADRKLVVLVTPFRTDNASPR